MQPADIETSRPEASVSEAGETGRAGGGAEGVLEAEPAWSVDEIVAQLNRPYSSTLPVSALREAQRRRVEITPRLIQLIEEATDTVAAGAETPLNDGPFFALYLLAEFQAREALPAVLRALTIPGQDPVIFFQGAIDEDIGRILTALSDDPVELLDNIIADSSLDHLLRFTCSTTFLPLVRDGLITRESAVERLRLHLRRAIESEDWESADFLVTSLFDYAPSEAMEDIQTAFDSEMLEFISRKEFDESLEDPETHFRETLENCRPTHLGDTVELLSGWACFHDAPVKKDDIPSPSIPRLWGEADAALTAAPRIDPPEPVATIRNTAPRVGRNDPCPCGSSKKYKKCCGRS